MRQLFKLTLITACLSLSAQAAPQTSRVIVAFKPGQQAAVKQLVHAAGGVHKLDIHGMDAMAVELPRVALRGLQHNPKIEYIEEDAKRYPLALTSPSTGSPYELGQLVPYGIPLVQADQLPSGDANTSNRKICIIDSGYDLAHEDLSKANVTGGDYDPNTGWWYTDELGHGTHVAGTIAAVNQPGRGVVGVNPNQKINLHIIKVFSASGWAYASNLISAANKCGDAGANVISMSLGSLVPSNSERNVFASLHKRGILNVAAAGNYGFFMYSYPASYDSVMSVAAVDENMIRATFSEYNDAVEISAPGVNVYSTVPMGTGKISSLSVGDTSYSAGGVTGSPLGTVTAPLADFGIGDIVDPLVSGKICLIKRGTNTFLAKVINCRDSGGIGAVIYNNVAGSLSATLGTTTPNLIPTVSVSNADGLAMMAGQLGLSATIKVEPYHYGYSSGTSMATPHVSAVAAMVWSYFPQCTAAEIRSTLQKSALDISAPGKDNFTGYGLVQAKAAYDRIVANGCGL